MAPRVLLLLAALAACAAPALALSLRFPAQPHYVYTDVMNTCDEPMHVAIAGVSKAVDPGAVARFQLCAGACLGHEDACGHYTYTYTARTASPSGQAWDGSSTTLGCAPDGDVVDTVTLRCGGGGRALLQDYEDYADGEDGEGYDEGEDGETYEGEEGEDYDEGGGGETYEEGDEGEGYDEGGGGETYEEGEEGEGYDEGGGGETYEEGEEGEGYDEGGGGETYEEGGDGETYEEGDDGPGSPGINPETGTGRGTGPASPKPSPSPSPSSSPSPRSPSPSSSGSSAPSSNTSGSGGTSPGGTSRTSSAVQTHVWATLVLFGCMLLAMA